MTAPAVDHPPVGLERIVHRAPECAAVGEVECPPGARVVVGVERGLHVR
jgi:hypothetical protein